jgi:hypothetical protein
MLLDSQDVWRVWCGRTVWWLVNWGSDQFVKLYESMWWNDGHLPGWTRRAIGKFRTSSNTITITITNTSSFCGYVRRRRDVIVGRFAGVNEVQCPFSYFPNEHNFVHWVLWNGYICILSMGLCLIDANNHLNRAVIFVLIQLKPASICIATTKTTSLSALLGKTKYEGSGVR